MNISFYVILAYVILTGAEAWYQRRAGHSYRLNVAMSNMSCGVLSLCTGVFSAIAFAFSYSLVETRLGFIKGLGWQWWSVVLAFLMIDLCYYAYHRASHRIAILWGAHIVHHQSDEYNLTVSLRQGSFSQLTSIPFYLAPAVAGVPLKVFLVVNGAYQLYQFFVHTAVVTNMGWLEHVLATPRIHRTHHARNEEYIDCNYSGFLLLWDQIFGSYRPPSVEPVYGVTQPISSWSPFWANTGYVRELFAKARCRRGWERLWTFFAPPEWCPVSECPKSHTAYVEYNARPLAGNYGAMIVTFAACLVAASAIEALPKSRDLPLHAAVAITAALFAWFTSRFLDSGSEWIMTRSARTNR